MHVLQLQKSSVPFSGSVLMESVIAQKYFNGEGTTEKLINLMVQVIFTKKSVHLCS